MRRAFVGVLAGALGWASTADAGVVVVFGEMEHVILLRPTSDPARWYLPLESKTVGPHLLMLDTGAATSSCDDDFITALGVPAKAKHKLNGPNGPFTARKATLPTLGISGHKVSGLKCIVHDLATTSTVQTPPEVLVAGILGLDLLKQFRVVIDPEQGRLELHNPEGATTLDRNDYAVVPMRPRGAHVTVPAVLGGNEQWLVPSSGVTESRIDGTKIGKVPEMVPQASSNGSDLATAPIRAMHKDVMIGVGEAYVGPIDVVQVLPEHAGLLGLDVLQESRQEYDFHHLLARFTQADASRLPLWRTWEAKARGTYAVVLDP